ncbi:hypothetical protein D3C85_1388990 [compost metagenome]
MRRAVGLEDQLAVFIDLPRLARFDFLLGLQRPAETVQTRDAHPDLHLCIAGVAVGQQADGVHRLTVRSVNLRFEDLLVRVGVFQTFKVLPGPVTEMPAGQYKTFGSGPAPPLR